MMRALGPRDSSSVYFVLVAFLTLVPALVIAAPCPFGISPETSQRLFERMQSMAPGPGYHALGVATNKSELLMHWTLHGEACPPIRAEIESCWSTLDLPVFRLDVPPEVGVRCPALLAVLPQFTKPAGRRAGLIIAVALTLIVAVMIRRARWWALAFAAALPLLLNFSLALNIELGAAWIAFAVLLYDRHFDADHTRRHKRALFALVLFSLLLDGLLSSGGPGDLRMNLAGIWASAWELRWGPAPVALFRVLGFVLGSMRDTDIHWINLLVSSLVPVLLYAIVVELGVGEVAALLAAFVVAAHPLLISVSGVLERQPLYLFAACGSIFALITYLKRGGWERLAAFVIGTLLAVATRPEGAHVLVVQGAIACVVSANRRSRLTAAAALACLAGVAILYLHEVVGSKAPIGKPLPVQDPILWTILFDPDFTPRAWIAAGLLGLVWGIRRRAAWAAAVSVFGLDLVWWKSGVYSMFAGYEHQVASARYETILLVPLAICIALFGQAVLRAQRFVQIAVGVVFVAATAATFQPTYDTLIRPFTIDYEYRFLKKHALALPPQARLYVFNAPLDDVGFIDAHLVGQFVGSPVSFAPWSDRRCAEWTDSSETYLYLGSSCAELVDALDRSASLADNLQWLADCRAKREQLADDLVDEVEVPARKMSWHNFKDASVRLSLYRLRDRSRCES